MLESKTIGIRSRGGAAGLVNAPSNDSSSDEKRRKTPQIPLAKRAENIANLIVNAAKSITLKHLFVFGLAACLLVFMYQNDIIIGKKSFLVKRVTNLNRRLTQSQFYLHFWTFISPGAYLTWTKAKAYYEQQRPLFEEAARNFEVHPYWLRTKIDRVDVGWYEMITLRAKAMSEMWDESRRDDFRIEKDKCEMYRFFARNKFRTAPIHGYWNSHEKFTEDLFSDKAIPTNASWPTFFKCCHLTQGSSESTRMLKSREWVYSNEHMLKRFIKEKWDYRADDWERPWAIYLNKLTDSLTPGIMVQGPYSTSFEEMSRIQTVVELKVETFWGRAYLASCNFGRDTVILRDGSIEIFPTWWQSKVNAHTESPYNTWIRNEGHLEKAWKLAETAAKIMGIDQVRIDIFIKKGDPNAIAINENSISSGMGYRAHFEFMPKIWAEGHAKKWYKEYKGASKDLPVYFQNFPAKHCPNQHLIDSEPPYV